jgi:dienelactone hydrolase
MRKLWLSVSLLVGMLLQLNCGSTTAKCSEATCSGCCDATGACQSGDSQTACGAAGASCQSCTSIQACVVGQCQQRSVGGGTATSDGGTSDGGLESADAGVTVAGCGTQRWPARAADRSTKGPWAVGAIHTTIRGMSVEVWYPAAPGSEVGQARLRYDIRDDLPPVEAAKISETDNPYQPCDCVRDLPIDPSRGPFPLVVFVHGTAAFKTQNLDNAVQWASHGFVVMAANHPGLSISSFLGPRGTQNLTSDVQAEIAAMSMPAGDLAMFAGRVDVSRIGLAGHSAGGSGVAGMGSLPGVQVIIPISAGAASTGSNVQSTLFVSGTADNVASYTGVTGAYNQTATRMHKRLVGIRGAAHTGVTSLCEIKNAAGRSIIEVAQASGVLTGILGTFASTLFDCARNTTPQAQAVPIVNAATTAVLEETLQCDATAAAALATLPTQFPAVQDYLDDP